MKVLGRMRKNYIVELTPKEMDTIRTALLEWGIVEEDTSKPDRRFAKLDDKIVDAINRFDSLPIIRGKALKNATAGLPEKPKAITHDE